MSVSLDQLIQKNQAWVQAKTQQKPDYFQKMAKGQQPHTLWVGCADSRVPPNEITQTEPGELFVHRNVANLIVTTDLNFLSVLQYSVEVLKVQRVVVCGHYGCGGVKASMGPAKNGMIDNWLHQIRDTQRIYGQALKGLSEEDQFHKLVEFNVRQQVINVCNTAIIQQAWETGEQPQVHGLVYDLGTGVLHSLTSEIKNNQDLSQVFNFV